MHRRLVQLAAAAAGLALTVYIVGEVANSWGIGLDFERDIPAQLPKDPVTAGRDYFTAGPRYPFHFRRGFQEYLGEYLVPRPYVPRNRLKPIDGYAMYAQIYGWNSCERQIQGLSAEFGSARVLRALRWKYCTWFDRMELHHHELQLTCGAIICSLVIFSAVRMANRFGQRPKGGAELSG